jgi:hypothetical protein
MKMTWWRAGKLLSGIRLVKDRGFHHPICSDVLRALDAKQISQSGAGSVDPALDRADPCAANRSRLLVRKSLRTHEEESLSLVDGQLG